MVLIGSTNKLELAPGKPLPMFKRLFTSYAGYAIMKKYYSSSFVRGASVTTSKVTSKGQTTIPKGIRERLGIKTGDRVAFLLRDDGVLLRPVKGTLLDLRGSIKPRKRPDDLDEVRRAAKETLAKKAVRGG